MADDRAHKGLPKNAFLGLRPKNNQEEEPEAPAAPSLAIPLAPRAAEAPVSHATPAEAEPEPASERDQYFSEYFDDSEEDEEMVKVRNAPVTYQHSTAYSETEEILKAKLRDLRQQYPRGGMKAFQFVTTEAMLKAPEDFFSRYEKDVREVTSAVQALLSEKGIADLVGQAQSNQFDEELQDKAFRAVQGMASEYMERLAYKGVERHLVVYMAAMDIIGMSRIDPLWRDKEIDEIICNGPYDIQIEIKGRLVKVPSARFQSTDHLMNLLDRVFRSLGKSLSRTTPYLDGRLYDQSRIAATHPIISPAGPNVAIRRHPEKWWTPMDLVKFDAASNEMFEDIGNWVNKGCSYIVIGGTGSGKTSMLNATSGFFEPTQRVLTLEDNLELKLHPNKWVGAPMEVLPGNPHKENDHGVTMRELVRACLRMRPDGIVVGEVRDGAMYDLCQALNTGHWGCSTVHANSPEEGIYRMQSLVTQAEVVSVDGALALIASAFDFIIMIERFPQDGSRKVTSVAEIAPFPTPDENGRLRLEVTRLWEYEADEFVMGETERVTGQWVKKNDMSEARRKRRYLDMTPDKSWEELQELCAIPEKYLKGLH